MTLVACGLVHLCLHLPVIALELILHGAGMGIMSIARGTVPLALFGASDYSYRSDSSVGKQFVEFRSREARILHGPWDPKPSRGQCYGSAVSVQLDFSGKHETKIANRSASFSAVFFFRGAC